MPRRLRQHVNPLALHHLGVGPERIVLPTDRTVEVELGCGDGQFLFERAAARPEGFFLGLEIRLEWVDLILARGVANVRALRSNLLEGRPRFEPDSVARFHINFPDPLFKRGHRAHRRWLDEARAEDLRRALREGGEIFFQSDVFEPSLDALAVLEATPGLRNVSGEWCFCRANPYGARSRREAWCEEHGVRIWRCLFRKTGD